MNKRQTTLAASAVALLALAGVAWLLWGDYFRPHEAVRVLDSGRASAAPPAGASAAGSPATPAAANASATAASAFGPDGLPGLGGPPASPALAPAQPVTPANAATQQDPLQAFRRAIEEANARQAAQAAQGHAPAPAPRFTSLPEAIEAARRAQQASAPLPPAPEPAPGAAINPFSSR